MFPTFTRRKPPDYQPPEPARKATMRSAGDKPFILHPDGLGWIWVPSGLKDGPLPTHYEPLESPVRNPLYPARQTNPAAERRSAPTIATPTSPDAALSLCAYHLSPDRASHGGRNVPHVSHLAELQPEFSAKSRRNWRRKLRIDARAIGSPMTTPRGMIEARALVTHAHACRFNVRGKQSIKWACHIIGATRGW